MNRIAPLIILLLAACSGGAPTDTPTPFVRTESAAPISLRNATPEPLAYVAVGEGALALIDLRPTLEQGEYDDRLVGAGETRPVDDIIAYTRGNGVGFHLYRVDPVSGDARYAHFLLATGTDLARNGGLVTVTAFGP
ncbi:MAG TPA: hypothetical protein VMN37_04405 [Gemmatimonadales bacterium]|nr:hypothetical protein [Gemmatimonadales bacterium]